MSEMSTTSAETVAEARAENIYHPEEVIIETIDNMEAHNRQIFNSR